VLQLLALAKDRILSIADRRTSATSTSRRRICYASIVNRRDRLGDILVKHGKITKAKLEARAPADQGARQEAGRGHGRDA